MTATHTQIKREMVALNADVVGFSRLMADDLESTTAAMEGARTLVADEVVNNSGVLVNFVGDNFMAVFDSAMDAMKAAISISSALTGAAADGTTPVQFRMGIDQGIVSIGTDGEHFGDALNIAARIQAKATPGGVSVSNRVYKALDEPELRFHPVGSTTLKNIPGETSIYQFADLPADADDAGRFQTLSLVPPTLALLPIHTELVDQSLHGVAQLLRSDLLHRLTRIPNLTVIEANLDSERSSETTVQYLVETGVHQFGENVRVYAQLIDVGTMNFINSFKWTAPVDSALSLSDQISEDVSRALEVELIVGEPARLYNELEDAESIEMVYQGWYHLTAGTPDGWHRAVQLFEGVATLHPDSPYGHVLAAFANWMGAANGANPDREGGFQKAYDQAVTGIAAGDPTGMGQTVEAAILMSQGRADEAIQIVEELEISRPTCDVTFALEGSVRRYMGEWDKAVSLLDTAMAMSPVNKPWYPTVQACSLYLGGRLDHAASTAEAVVEFQPNNLEALLVLAATQSELGLDRRARATGDSIRERFSSEAVDDWLNSSPYQDRETIDRWRASLVAAGVFAPFE